MGNNPGNVANMVLQSHHRRRVPGVGSDFDNFWGLAFYSADAEQGFELKAETSEGFTNIYVKKVAELLESTVRTLPPGVVPDWVLSIVATTPSWAGRFEVYSVADRVVMPLPHHFALGAWAQAANVDDLSTTLDVFSSLAEDNREAVVEELLRNIEPDLKAIRILTRSGQPSLNVKPSAELPLLPMAVMGWGFQRCFDIAIHLATSHLQYLSIDEVDNGLHHSLLVPVWRWIARASKQIGAQINLTTHSEECVAAAAQVFKELGDDGLRVIRIDKRKDGSRAAVYDADLASVAVDEGVEIRG
jgi:hypothetical protein